MDRHYRKPPLQASKQHLQRLTVQEEESIINAVYQLDAWGWLMTVKAINQLATELLVKKGDMAPIRRNWYYNFLYRYPELRTRRLRALD